MEVRIYVCSIRMDFVISSGFTLRQYRLKELSTNIHAITEQPGTADEAGNGLEFDFHHV